MVTPLKRNTPHMSSLNIIIGAWLFLSPLFLSYPKGTGASGSNIICGIAIAIFAAIRAMGLSREPWLSSLNALLGLWVLVSPWVLGFQPVWGNAIAGLIVITLSLSSVAASRQTYG